MRVLAPVLLFLLLAAAAATVRATLQFATRRDAVTYVATYAARHAALRLALSHGTAGSAALAPAELDTLLVSRLHLITPAAGAAGVAAADKDDVRQRYLPAAWMPEALITYGGGALTAAAVNASAALPLPPPEVRDVLAALMVYATTLADDLQCPNVNEVPVPDPTTPGALMCECAEGHLCASGVHALSADVDLATALPRAVAITAFCVLGVLVLFVIVQGIADMRRVRRLLQAPSREQQRLVKL
jgi:hypothetical protein